MAELDELIEEKAKQYVAKEISNTTGEHVYPNHLKVVEHGSNDAYHTLLLEYPYDDDVAVYLVRSVPYSSCIDFVVSPLVEDDRKVIVYSPEVADNGDVLPTKLDLEQDQEEPIKVDTLSAKEASDFVNEKIASLKDSNYQRLIKENNELKKQLEKANNYAWEDLHEYLDFPGFRKAEKELKKAINSWLDSENSDKQ